MPAAAVRASMPRLMPTRPVVLIALLLFAPALLLVLDGNLSVQAALVRFAGALVVSWVAARLVFVTVQAYARTGSPRDRAAEASTPEASTPESRA